MKIKSQEVSEAGEEYKVPRARPRRSVQAAKYSIGDVVGIMNKGKRIDCVITGTRGISRGNWAGATEYSLAPLEGPQGKAYGYKVKGEKLFGTPTREYTEAEITDIRKGYHRTEQAVVDQKAEKRSHRQGLLDRMEITAGDEVLIRYSNATPKWEKVAKVNMASGNVAIETPYRDKPRWIDVRHVADSRKPQAPLPFKVTDAHLDDLAEKGWVQVRFGAEFIERSFVAAFTAADAARKGMTYECADATVYHDPELKVYWRRTGSFD